MHKDKQYPTIERDQYLIANTTTIENRQYAADLSLHKHRVSLLLEPPTPFQFSAIPSFGAQMRGKHRAFVV